MHAYRDRSGLDPRVTVGRSAIDGRGLFATGEISAGEVVAVIGGRSITDAALRELSEHSSLAVGGGWNLLQDADDPLRYGNHSCDPNLWLTDAVTLVARRPIGIGEELTTDYAASTDSSSWSMTCHCASQLCRGLFRGTVWRRADLQARYGGIFAPFLKERLAAAEAR
jgi:SET domain-containing protein